MVIFRSGPIHVAKKVKHHLSECQETCALLCDVFSLVLFCFCYYHHLCQVLTNVRKIYRRWMRIIQHHQTANLRCKIEKKHLIYYRQDVQISFYLCSYFFFLITQPLNFPFRHNLTWSRSCFNIVWGNDGITLFRFCEYKQLKCYMRFCKPIFTHKTINKKKSQQRLIIESQLFHYDQIAFFLFLF